MKNRHLQALLVASLLSIFVVSPAFAIDLRYDPEQDAPTSNEEPSSLASEKSPKQLLPGERDSSNTINTTPGLSKDDKRAVEAASQTGWVFKAPSLSSDKEPNITDERESVRMAEEQRWRESGKNYDDNLLNKDNYRINVEAEYTF
ncbi:hypothetical protein [Alkalimarinus coralli]|uniref:hypothetical protein n=1 Tax=Alkalimarinus coralli TaxID=2935863 RepID=UPI00202B7F84|nr:hypothetical protein [Alkalimarinus coralli]